VSYNFIAYVAYGDTCNPSNFIVLDHMGNDITWHGVTNIPPLKSPINLNGYNNGWPSLPKIGGMGD
jgi:hypothetical protein